MRVQMGTKQAAFEEVSATTAGKIQVTRRARISAMRARVSESGMSDAMTHCIPSLHTKTKAVTYKKKKNYPSNAP